MRQAEVHTEHGIEIECNAAEVYDLLSDVSNWPRIFPPTIYVESFPTGENSEDIAIWATANGVVKSWTSERFLDPDERRITFQQKRFQSPVASMRGTWEVQPLGQNRCQVSLLHDFSAEGDLKENIDWIRNAVETNSNAELGALKSNAEAGSDVTGLLLEFEDEVEVNGSARACFNFVNEAEKWRSRLGHVAEVRLEEDSPGVQSLEMDTVAKDGSVHTTKSFRICFDPEKIVYKQTTLPPLMSVHNGQWHFVSSNGGNSAIVRSRHVVLLNPEKIREVLGPEADVASARKYVREALSTNSLLTLQKAKAFAEEAADVN